MLSAIFLRQGPHRDLPHATRSGHRQDVGGYLTGQAIDEAVSKVSTAHERCARAESYAADGQLEAAHDAYRRVFGRYYPAG